jgi:hypothetical protein
MLMRPILQMKVQELRRLIRDDKGNILAAQCKYIPHVADAMMVEATAMHDGLVFAHQFEDLDAQKNQTESITEFCTWINSD